MAWGCVCFHIKPIPSASSTISVRADASWRDELHWCGHNLKLRDGRDGCMDAQCISFCKCSKVIWPCTQPKWAHDGPKCTTHCKYESYRKVIWLAFLIFSLLSYLFASRYTRAPSYHSSNSDLNHNNNGHAGQRKMKASAPDFFFCFFIPFHVLALL